MRSCQAACCQRPACDAFWFLGNTCVQVNCTMPGTCQADRTGFSDSILVFLKKSNCTECSLNFQMDGDMKMWFHKWLDSSIPVQRKKRLRRSLQIRGLAGDGVELLKRDIAVSPSGEAAARASNSKSRSSRSGAESLKDQILRRLVAEGPEVPEDHLNQKTDWQNGQHPREQKAKSPLPPKSNNVSRSSDVDSVGLPQVSVMGEMGLQWGCLGWLPRSCSVLLCVDFEICSGGGNLSDACFQPPVNKARPRVGGGCLVFWQ